MGSPSSLAHKTWYSGDYPELEHAMHEHQARMRRWCQRQTGKLRSKAFHLVLGGGYGRGEGGVSLDDEHTPAFHNDLDYFLFVDNAQAVRELREPISQIEAEESAHLSVDVEIQALPVSSINSQAHTLMMADLTNGHDTVFGDLSKELAVIPKDSYAHIPIREATRLLWNRGSGLYFCKQALHMHEEPEIDLASYKFIIRNLQKVYLALGDCYLLKTGNYHCRVSKRAEIIAQDPSATFPNYAEAAQFKERPFFPNPIPSKKHLEAEVDAAIHAWTQAFLELESSRLQHTFAIPADYIYFSGRLYPEESIFQNPLVHLRDQLRHGSHLGGVLDYPRGTLQRLLCAIFNQESSFIKTMAWPADVLSEPFKEAYTAWWGRYS